VNAATIPDSTASAEFLRDPSQTQSFTPVRAELILDETTFVALAERAAEILFERHGYLTDTPRWPEYMNVVTTAAYLDVSEERVRKLKERGEIHGYQEGPGCRVFFNRRELDEYMADLRSA
jgi:excisionase family DNA binding protein